MNFLICEQFFQLYWTCCNTSGYGVTSIHSIVLQKYIPILVTSRTRFDYSISSLNILSFIWFEEYLLALESNGLDSNFGSSIHYLIIHRVLFKRLVIPERYLMMSFLRSFWTAFLALSMYIKICHFSFPQSKDWIC